MASGWALPVGSLVLALLAIPLMFVAPMSFVIGLGVATGASLAGAVAAQNGQRTTPQRLIGAVSCLSLLAALALLTVPFVLQD